MGNVPYEPADEQLRSLIDTVFPHERDAYAVSPFGDLFDAITADAPESALENYRALVFAGQPRVDAKLAVALKRYVEKGGLLFLCLEQTTPELGKLAGVTDTGMVGRDSEFLRASDFYVYTEPREFEYHKVELAGAEPLFLAGKAGERKWPIATLNRVGAGAIIVGTPLWLRDKEDHHRLHGVFSEIVHLIADELVPVRVYGDSIKVLYNRNDRGWIVTLLNNEGVTTTKPGFRPALRERSSAGVVLKPKFEFTSATEWLTGEKLPRSKGIGLVVPPGDIRIVEFDSK